MELSGKMEEDFAALKELLPAEDILSFDFAAEGGIAFRILYCDPVTDKDLLGTLVVRPLMHYRGGRRAEEVGEKLASPEMRAFSDLNELAGEVLAGNPVLLWDGMDEALVVGTKKVFLRAVMEPPTNVAVKGPREGFIEDVKVNTSLVRRRLKTGELKVEFLKIGRRSQTFVALCYLEGTAEEAVVRGVEERLKAVDIDGVPDSSYLADFLSSRPHALIKQVGTTEKPDIFCAKLLEGRVGVLVDGSPIALTLPYLLTEDLQAAEDYFVPALRATLTRLVRLFGMLAAMYLPAFYVAAKLFKLQLFPLKLLLTIAGSIRDIPLSPSLEMLLVLLMLEVLNEASIRMPKYVGMALSVVGALVLGETAVRAGIFSTPTIIIVALSGIGLYAVPDLIETTSVMRLFLLLMAGSLGTYGILLATAAVLYELTATENFGVPLMAPFAPADPHDMKDSIVKFSLRSLKERPHALLSPNKRRMK